MAKTSAKKKKTTRKPARPAAKAAARKPAAKAAKKRGATKKKAKPAAKKESVARRSAKPTSKKPTKKMKKLAQPRPKASAKAKAKKAVRSQPKPKARSKALAKPAAGVRTKAKAASAKAKAKSPRKAKPVPATKARARAKAASRSGARPQAGAKAQRAGKRALTMKGRETADATRPAPKASVAKRKPSGATAKDLPAAKPAPTVKPLRIRAAPTKSAVKPIAAAGPPIDRAAVLEKLQTKKEEILALYLADLRSGQESNDSPTEDIVDRANNAYSRELSFSISDAERSLLLQVEAAIERVEKGSYGRCANCGEPIAAARLEAVPWARYCIFCQELLEQGMLAEA